MRDGRIAHVGTTAGVLAAAGATTRKIDLAGRTLVPGMNDAHAHVWKIGHLLTSMLDVRRVTSIDELVSGVKAFSARLPPGAWLLGRGYNEAAMKERRSPTRADLDRAEPGRPVVLTRTCGHMYALNSAALKEARIGVDTAAPVGGVIDRDDRGEPTGVLRETAMGLVNKVLPPPTAGDYEAMIVAALRHQLALGITSSADCGVTPQLLDVYRAVAEKHRPAGARERHAASPRGRRAGSRAAADTARVRHAARGHGEVSCRRRPERCHGGAARELSPRGREGGAAFRAGRAPRAVRRGSPRRVAHRDSRDWRCRDRSGARHLRRPWHAPARSVASHRTPRRAGRRSARARGEAARHRGAAGHLHPQPGRKFPQVSARLVSRPHVSDPGDARRRCAGRVVIGRAGGRGRQPVCRHDGGRHPAATTPVT